MRKQERDDKRAEEMANREAERQQRLDELRKEQLAAITAAEKARADVMVKVAAQKAEQDVQFKPPQTEEEVQRAFEELFGAAEAGRKETETRPELSSKNMQGTFSSVAASIMAATGGNSKEQELLNVNKDQLKQQNQMVTYTGQMARDLADAWTVK